MRPVRNVLFRARRPRGSMPACDVPLVLMVDAGGAGDRLFLLALQRRPSPLEQAATAGVAACSGLDAAETVRPCAPISPISA